MIKKNFVIKNNKLKLGFTKIGLLSIFPATIFVGSVNAAIYSQQNYNNIKSTNKTISNYNANLDNIVNFNSYSPIYYDANTQVATTVDGTIGLNSDKTILILTSYSGNIIWANDLKNNQIIKDFYSANKQISSLENYSIKTFEKVDNQENTLAVIFGDSNNDNQIFLTIDLKTGNIITKADGSYSINIIDGYKANAIFNLSANNRLILIRADGSVASEAFSKVVTVELNDDGSIKNYSAQEYANKTELYKNPNDIFLGFVSSKKGSDENFAVFYDQTSTNKNMYLAIKHDSFSTKLISSNTYAYTDLTWKTENLEATDIATKHIKHFQIYGDKNSWVDESTKSIKFVMPWHTRSWHAQDAEENDTGWKKGIRIIEVYNDSNNNDNRTPRWWTRPTSGDLNSFTIVNDLIYYTTRTTDSVDSKSYASVASFSTDNNYNLNVVSLLDNTQNWDNSKVTIAPIYNQNTNNKIDYVLAHPNTSNDLKLTLNYGDWNKTDTTINRNSQDVEFSVRNDVASELKNAAELKNKTADLITTNDLLPYLKFRTSNSSDYNTPSSTYKISNDITNVNADEGKLDYSYTISYTPFFDSTLTLSYELSGTLDNLYKLNNLDFKFVNSENIDSSKWNEINKLKQSKYAKEITKQNIIDYFIVYKIIDKDGNQLNIDESMITLTASDDQSNLTVVINLPRDKFPANIDKSKLTYTETFDGFLNINVWSYNVFEVANDALKQYYPSEIKMSKLLETQMVTLGTGYSKEDQHWKIDAVANDITGELVINSITYTNPNNNVPTGYDSLITNKLTYSGLKNTVDLFVDKPTINHIVEDDNNVLTPTQIWDEYKNAVDSNNDEAIKNTYIYKSLSVSNLLVNPLDLKLEVLNYDTANTDKKLEYSATIKESAQLVYTYGNNNKVTFTNEYKNKLIQNKPDAYPFKLSQNIHTKVEAFIDVNNNNKQNVNVNQDNKTATVDLTSDSLNSINKNIYVDDFINNFDNYQNDILSIFSYNLYSTNVSISSHDLDKGIVIVKVDFTRDASANSGDLNVTYTITLNGFSIKPTLVVNQSEINTNNMVYDATVNKIDIDLSKDSFKSINSTIVIKSFVNEINNYQSDLLSLFDYQGYEVKLTTKDTNYSNKNVSINIEFSSSYDSHTYTINLLNFDNYDYLDLNLNELTNNENIDYDFENKSIDIDVSENSFYNINSDSKVDEILNSFDLYQDNITNLFDCASGYTISNVNPYNDNNTLVVEITYTTNNQTTNSPNEIKSIVKISGFKTLDDQTVITPQKPSSDKSLSVGILAGAAFVFLLIILLILFFLIRAHKNTKIDRTRKLK